MSTNEEMARFIVEHIASYTSLEGSIGAGKSTLLEGMKKDLSERGLLHTQFDRYSHGIEKQHVYVVIDEPLDQWTNHLYSTQKFGDVPDPAKRIGALDLFYTDKTRWGFLFQVKAFTSRLKLIYEELKNIYLLTPHAHVHVIAERSLLADRTMFRNVYECGHVVDAEWEIYNEFFNLITEKVVEKATGMIYVKTSPTRCHERLERRARSVEVGRVVPDYLVSLDRLHDEMVDDFSKVKTNYVDRLNFEDDVPPESIGNIAKDVVSRLITHVQKH